MPAKVEIVGLDKLKRALVSIPQDMRAPILRDIARKPASQAAGIARRLFPYGNTGKTVRTIGVLKVKNGRQPYVEVGFRGRSLGYIYISKSTIQRAKRGTIKGTPWLFHRSGDMIMSSAKRQMKVELGGVIARHLRKYGYSPRMRL